MNEQGVSRKLIDIREGERIDLAGVATVELVHKTGRAARLQISAPRDMKIEKKSVPVRDKHAIVEP